MKISDITPKPITYLDLDDTLVDFGQAIADYEGIPVEEFYNREYDHPKYIETVVNCETNGDICNFFSNLKWRPHAKKLVKWIKNNNIPYGIISKPLSASGKISPEGTAESIRGKHVWLKNNDFINIPIYLVMDKTKYAINNGTSNILIDDLTKNVESFSKAGGIGILYQDRRVDEIINQLRRIYEKI